MLANGFNKNVFAAPAEGLSCPFCLGYGTSLVDGQHKCDAHVTIKQCPVQMVEPVCATHSIHGVFRRFCLPKEEYNRHVKLCEDGKCVIAMCEESGCKASGMVTITFITQLVNSRN